MDQPWIYMYSPSRSPLPPPSPIHGLLNDSHSHRCEVLEGWCVSGALSSLLKDRYDRSLLSLPVWSCIAVLTLRAFSLTDVDQLWLLSSVVHLQLPAWLTHHSKQPLPSCGGRSWRHGRVRLLPGETWMLVLKPSWRRLLPPHSCLCHSCVTVLSSARDIVWMSLCCRIWCHGKEMGGSWLPLSVVTPSRDVGSCCD